MVSVNTSLLREKFTIYDSGDAAIESGGPIIALSNRLELTLKSKSGDNLETYIIRTQNMHSCVRMAARVLRSYFTTGPIMNRPTAYNWEGTWESSLSDYEMYFNPDRWCAIYHKGKTVFQTGDHHPFLDVIEQCYAKSKKQYEHAVPLAEQAFGQAGKPVNIHHDSNVALVLDLEDDLAKCGVILRGPNRTTTFNFSVSPKKGKELHIPQVMNIAASFLEGVQLGFMVGMNNEKIRIGLIERHSAEEKHTREAKRRLSRLSADIANLESAAEVRYRPERPEFQHVVMDAERVARKILKPPPPPEGDEDDDEEWVE